jgi:RNA polymerase sigma factor (sigma-70 family)
LERIHRRARPRAAFPDFSAIAQILKNRRKPTMACNPYRPDYAKLYPGVEIDGEILRALKEGDRKEEYAERDLKRGRHLRDRKGRIVHDGNGQPVELPERETSLEALCEAGRPLPGKSPSAEDEAVEAEASETEELHRCLGLLEPGARKLIGALFFENMTERECADSIGLSKTALHARKKKILAKLKKLMSE